MSQRHIKISHAMLGDGRLGVGMYILKAWDPLSEQSLGRLDKSESVAHIAYDNQYLDYQLRRKDLGVCYRFLVM